MKLSPSAVKSFALQKGIDILQPTNLKSEEFAQQLSQYNPNIQVVIAFRMMPEKVWNYPEHGTINLHASLLPNYRGAAPINWAVINGETETGVTTFRLKHEIDTGNILRQQAVEISQEDTAGTMHDRLMTVGADLMVSTLNDIAAGTAVETAQIISETVRKAPKIFKQHCEIDWSLNAKQVFNLIRGLSPYPVARTKIGGKTLKVFSSEIIERSRGNEQAGSFASDNKSYIHVACADQYLSLTMVQLEGKRRMNIDEFLRGFDITQEPQQLGDY